MKELDATLTELFVLIHALIRQLKSQRNSLISTERIICTNQKEFSVTSDYIKNVLADRARLMEMIFQNNIILSELKIIIEKQSKRQE